MTHYGLNLHFDPELTKLLVFGYIRLNYDIVIPQDVERLCFLYYFISFEDIKFRSFDPNKTLLESDCNGIHIHGDIENDNRCFTLISMNGGWQTGVHRWKIKCLFKDDSTETAIGICSVFDDKYDSNNPSQYKWDWNKLEILYNDFLDNIQNQIRTKHYLYCYNHKIWYDGFNSFDKRFEAEIEMIENSGGYDKNDVMIISLDCDNWNITWFISKYYDNEYMEPKQIGQTISLDKHRYYYPMICSTSKTDKFQVLCN